ncbi:MAG: hypothetical protein Q9174_004847 [Haloplaca sp. 1 TL-2023]
MEDYKSKTQMLAALFTVFFLLPLFAVVLRVIARRMKHMKLEWDDRLAIAALAVLFGNYVCQMMTLQQGLGKHSDFDSAADQLVLFMHFTFATEVLYAWALVLTKLSILHLYIRIFGQRGLNPKFRMAVHIVRGLVAAWGVSYILPITLQCKPLGAAWDPTKSREDCLDLRPFLVSTNVFNIVLDVGIIAMPLFPVWHIKVTRAKRVGLTGVFLLSAIATIMSILRLVAVVSFVFVDPTWNLVPVAIWSTIESTVGVVCCCLPVLAPVVQWTFEKVKGLPAKAKAWKGNRGLPPRPSPNGANHLLAISNNRSGVTVVPASSEGFELNEILAAGPLDV